ncbi:hypothetical protein [Nostoc sp.]|uniref:hypothetical protein n=1 Tax=Nostoc sp. TaxID=1180 RepID=UPI002FF82310
MPLIVRAIASHALGQFSFGDRICYFGDRICYFGDRCCSLRSSPNNEPKTKLDGYEPMF